MSAVHRRRGRAERAHILAGLNHTDGRGQSSSAKTMAQIIPQPTQVMLG